MPTYEYRCVDCGNRVEVVQRIGDDPLELCEICGGPLRKVFHPAGIVFKGSGFYTTDSRRRAASGATGDGEKGSSQGSRKEASPAKKDGASPTKKDGAKEAAS